MGKLWIYLCNHLNQTVLILGVVVTVGFFVLYCTRLKSKQLLNYIPNVWTSLGILGTFVAIVYSLNDAQAGNFSNVNTLIKNITPAFVTSIIGITGAVLSAIAIKIMYALEERKDDSVYAREVEGNIAPELLLNNIWKAVERGNCSINRLMSVTEGQRNDMKDFLDGFAVQLREFYGSILDTNSAHVQQMTDDYLHGIDKIITTTHTEVAKRIDEIVITHAQAVRDYITEESKQFKVFSDEVLSSLQHNKLILLDSIKRIEDEEIENLSNLVEQFDTQFCTTTNTFIASLDSVVQNAQSMIVHFPGVVESFKNDTIDALREALIGQYELLIEGHTAFVDQLLNKVQLYETDLAKTVSQESAQALEITKTEMQNLIQLLGKTSLDNATALSRVVGELSEDINKVASAFTTSSDGYKAIVTQIDRLLPALEKGVSNVEKSTDSSSQTNSQLNDLLKVVEELAIKNQQLRYELLQWKRVHKKVKVNGKNKTKECSNCSTANPIEANFCRKCARGFWDYEIITPGLGVNKSI